MKNYGEKLWWNIKSVSVFVGIVAISVTVWYVVFNIRTRF